MFFFCFPWGLNQTEVASFLFVTSAPWGNCHRSRNKMEVASITCSVVIGPDRRAGPTPAERRAVPGGGAQQRRVEGSG